MQVKSIAEWEHSAILSTIIKLLMQVKSIAECSKGSILQYFRPSLSYHLSLRSLFCLFLSGRFTQVLLYSLNAHADISSEAGGLKFGLSLHPHPYFVYASSKGSGKTVCMCRLVLAFAAGRCDKLQNLMYWPIFYVPSFVCTFRELSVLTQTQAALLLHRYVC